MKQPIFTFVELHGPKPPGLVVQQIDKNTSCFTGVLTIIPDIEIPHRREYYFDRQIVGRIGVPTFFSMCGFNPEINCSSATSSGSLSTYYL
jgi:hypothetical protein